MERIIPKKLKKGDTIGVVSPSNVIDIDDNLALEESVNLMKSNGFNVIFSKNARSNTLGYGATAKEKAEDVNEMFENKDVSAIFMAKGGQTSNSTFEYLDYELIRKNPKILCGFSDSTSITNMITQKTGLVTYSGSTFKALTSWKTDYAYKQVIEKFVDSRKEMGKDDDDFITLKSGNAEGILIGGNLSLIAQMSAGKYSLDFKDKILFIEELGYESPVLAVVSRLYYMKQNGVFDKIKGLWIGNFEDPNSNITLEKIVLDVLEDDYNFPIIKSENFGHIEKKTVIPIGAKARIDTNKKIKIEIIDDIVSE